MDQDGVVTIAAEVKPEVEIAAMVTSPHPMATEDAAGDIQPETQLSILMSTPQAVGDVSAEKSNTGWSLSEPHSEPQTPGQDSSAPVVESYHEEDGGVDEESDDSFTDKNGTMKLKKDKRDKAFPETRSLSGYVDVVIHHFASEMASQVLPVANSDVRSFIRSLMLFLHKHFTRRLHALAVMEGKGQFMAERVQYAAVFLLYELLHQNRARIWGPACTEQEARFLALEVCKGIARNLPALSEVGLLNHLHLFVADPVALFQATTPEIQELDIQHPTARTTFKIDLRTAVNFQSRVRAPRYSEMRMYVEDVESRAKRPRRKQQVIRKRGGLKVSQAEPGEEQPFVATDMSAESVTAVPPNENEDRLPNDEPDPKRQRIQIGNPLQTTSGGDFPRLAAPSSAGNVAYEQDGVSGSVATSAAEPPNAAMAPAISQQQMGTITSLAIRSAALSQLYSEHYHAQQKAAISTTASHASHIPNFAITHGADAHFYPYAIAGVSSSMTNLPDLRNLPSASFTNQFRYPLQTQIQLQLQHHARTLLGRPFTSSQVPIPQTVASSAESSSTAASFMPAAGHPPPLLSSVQSASTTEEQPSANESVSAASRT